MSGSAFAAPNSALTEQAYKALASGDRDQAVSLYTQAIESRDLAPDALANALLNRALAYQQGSRHDRAIIDYSSALKLDSLSTELRSTALYNRGLSYQKQKETALAVEDFTGALFLNSEFPQAYLSRANALRESGQYLFALSDYEKAIRFKHPDPARVHYGEALAYEALQRPAEMTTSLKLALAANPDYAAAKEKLAALDGAPPVQKADAITTGSIGDAGGELVVRKAELPKAVEPPAEMMVAAAKVPEPIVKAPVTKQITDRVPAAEEAPAPENQTASITPAPAPEERVVAVEPVAEEPAAEAPVPKVSGWTVQVASETSEDGAWSTWKKLKGRNKSLASAKPVVLKADLGGKGVFYRVRLIGYEDKASAMAACGKLKAAGVSCFAGKS